MKFEKRFGKVVNKNGAIVVHENRRLDDGARGCTQDEINEAFAMFDEPELPELPNGWRWENDCAVLGTKSFSHATRIYPNGEVRFGTGVVGFSSNLWFDAIVAHRIVVDYNARKPAEPEKPEVVASKLVLDDTTLCVRDPDGRTSFYCPQGTAVHQRCDGTTLHRVWLEPVEDNQ